MKLRTWLIVVLVIFITGTVFGYRRGLKTIRASDFIEEFIAERVRLLELEPSPGDDSPRYCWVYSFGESARPLGLDAAGQPMPEPPVGRVLERPAPNWTQVRHGAPVPIGEVEAADGIDRLLYPCGYAFGYWLATAPAFPVGTDARVVVQLHLEKQWRKNADRFVRCERHSIRMRGYPWLDEDRREEFGKRLDEWALLSGQQPVRDLAGLAALNQQLLSEIEEARGRKRASDIRGWIIWGCIIGAAVVLWLVCDWWIWRPSRRT